MESYSPLAAFAFVSSITPGPNNVMLSASGVAFGFRRTIPHLIGVWLGFILLLITCALGISALIERLPTIGVALKVGGSIYLIYFAWALRGAFDLVDSGGSSRPLKLKEAAAFQFINPKAWVMAITAITVFAANAESAWLATTSVCVVFSVVGVPCICSWAALGASIRSSLASKNTRHALGICMALLMAYAVVMMWI